MANKIPNNSIRCDVNECQNHCNDENCCSLHEISIGKCESTVDNCRCTDCESFRKAD